jgi:hypothetical protein
MKRCLLAAALFLALSTHALATTTLPGSTVEVEDCYYSFSLGGSWWSLECRYRIDGGEWRRAYQEGSGGEPELHLPGTSVHARCVNLRVEFSADEDVISLRVGSRQIK